MDQESSVRRYFEERYAAVDVVRGLLKRSLGGAFRREAPEIVAHCCDALASAPPRSVLDLGCGTGTLLAELHRRFSIERAVGVDFVARSLARSRNELSGSAVVLEESRVQSCAALDQAYDAVVSLGMFDYVPFERALLQRILAAARGNVVLTMPRRWLHAQRLVRWSWLRANGVRLLSYRRRDVEALCREVAGPAWELAVGAPAHLPDNLWIIGRRVR